ncbi:MAG TPA: glycosyltransferase family 87 protein [Candidatus Limnocylindria bacterium]|nr:glycosyltransferase family 87 protein [Candidatus Limnocylindria bacterium]
MLAKALERAALWILAVWRGLSPDAKVVGALGLANAALLVANHTTVQATSDAPLWRLFPSVTGPLWLALCALAAALYPYRDRRHGAGFTSRDRWVHLGVIVVLFAVVPTIASIVLRETGRPFTYVHDGAIMVEEAARKLLAGQNPYVTDYLDTPLYYWPMVNNPALYHLTYFPFLFLVTTPFVWLFDRIGLFWDQRYLYLPAYLATLAVLPLLVPRTPQRLALVALVGLNPQLFPFVVEGRNDFFVLVFLFAGIALVQRERRGLGALAIAVAGAVKLHALFLFPFLLVYYIAHPQPGMSRPRDLRGVWRVLILPLLPAAVFLAVTFLPFLVADFAAFYDDVVRYNAGGAAWSYPISGMGFSALLLALGIIPNPQADFPFAAVEIAVAAPIAAYFLRRLWRTPSIALMLGGYALTLLAFLFFGRYFQGNYLGYILAVASPIPFLREAVRDARSRRRVEGSRSSARSGRTAAKSRT